jgi:hypothetical protein
MVEFAVGRSSDGGTSGLRCVCVSGKMTIQHAHELKEAILEGFATGENILVDLTGVTDVDLAGIQVICAAHLFAAGAGRGFSVLGADGGAFAAARQAAGLSCQAGCLKGVGKSCFVGGGGE